MPELSSSNALRLGFTMEDVKSEIESMLKAKHWSSKGMDLAPTLVYIPHYVFHYSAFSEDDVSEGGDGGEDEIEEGEIVSKKGGKASKAVVSDIQHGTYSIDAASGELETDLGEYFETADLGPFEEPGEEASFERDTQKPKLSFKEAERLAQLKTAKELGVPKNNVEVSSMRLVYFPIWRVSVSVAKGEFDVDFSGVDGEVLSDEDIPERDKGHGELAGEAVSELSSPNKWVENFGNLVRDIYESEQLRAVGKFFLHDKVGRIILLLFVLALVLVFLGWIRF